MEGVSCRCFHGCVYGSLILQVGCEDEGDFAVVWFTWRRVVDMDDDLGFLHFLVLCSMKGFSRLWWRRQTRVSCGCFHDCVSCSLML